VRDFWQESGFLLRMDQPNLGIMETDWAENRAKIPQDFIRSTLGKLIDSCIPPPSATSSAPAWSARPTAAPRSTSATAA
jgi:outer membrane protein assembly factor BamC